MPSNKYTQYLLTSAPHLFYDKKNVRKQNCFFYSFVIRHKILSYPKIYIFHFAFFLRDQEVLIFFFFLLKNRFLEIYSFEVPSAGFIEKFWKEIFDIRRCYGYEVFVKKIVYAIPFPFYPKPTLS